MFSTAFARDLLERTIATFCEALAVFVVGDIFTDVDWKYALGVSLGVTLAAALKGIGAYAKDPETGASLLSDPPPRVERGHVDLAVVLLVGILVLVLLAVFGAFPHC